MRALTTVAGSLLAATIAAGCVGNTAYRAAEPLHESLRPPQFDPSQNDVGNWPYDLAFIEFDDRGEMFNRDQLTGTVELIANAQQRARQATQARRNKNLHAAAAAPLVVVFVHGWKNNASESSGNVWGFRQVLGGLSMQFATDCWRSPKTDHLGSVKIDQGWKPASAPAGGR